MTRPLGYAPWSPREATLVVLGQVDAVLAEYRAQWPLTVRQVFYRLVGAHEFPKTERDYKRLQEYLNRGRRAGRVPWAAIRDDGDTSSDPSWRYTDDDPVEWFRSMLPSAEDYLLHPQSGQERFIEVWCEAGGMVPMLARAVEDRGIPVYSGGGFDSVTNLRNHAIRHRVQGGPILVLYIGDYDPSGQAMYHRYRADVTAFGSKADWEQVAVLPEHIDTYGLTTAPPKKSDSRGVFTDTRTVQAEALPPDVLLGLLTDAVEAHWDDDVTEVVRRSQEAAQDRLRGLRERIDELLDGTVD